MFFSVIATVFNGEAFLAQCHDSILRNRARRTMKMSFVHMPTAFRIKNNPRAF